VKSTRRSTIVVIALLVTALAGFVHARPIAVFETWRALRLRLSGVRSSHVQAGAYRLHYLEAGSGPALVLVHGLGSHAAQDWGRSMVLWSRRLHVYAPDLPGFGRSDRPSGADYGVPMQVAALRDFMQAVGLMKARVAGISMGGWIVARLASENPERVDRLLVVAAAGMRPDGPPIPVDVLFPRDEDGVRSLVSAVRHNAPLPPSFVARDILAVRLREEWIMRRAVASMTEGRDWLDGTLRRADMPVLVVWGRQDRLIPVAYAARMQAEFPHARLEVLEGCGHVPMADCPEEFDRVSSRFLADAAVE
jgi:pimeloyl-ACP methyl ester carboxylesterase